MSILVVSATKHEKLEGLGVPQLITGVGTRNAIIGLAKYLQKHPEVDTVINAGFVGARNLDIGTAVSVDEVFYRDYDVDIWEETFESRLQYVTKYPPVACFTADCFFVGEPTKTSIDNCVRDFKGNIPTVFDMELAGIAQYLKDTGINLYSIKVVSDNGNLDEYNLSVNILRNQLYLALKECLDTLQHS